MNDCDHLGFYIKKIDDIIKTEFNLLLRPWNLTYSQTNFLIFLFGRKDKITSQKDLEQHFNLKHPTVIGILGRMENKGLVRIIVNNEDRRYRNIELTDKAFYVEELLRKNLVEMEKRLSRNLSENQSRELLGLLKIVYKNIAENENTPVFIN